jgi:hypothetical protein
VRVTGLDATPLFLELARADAAERGVEVEYVEGDMRSIPWTDRFDRVLCWFTSFGYFDDEESRQVLAEAYRALEPGGLLAIEMNNLLRLIQVYADEVVIERGDDKMIDRHRFDIQTSRSLDERTIIRGGKRRSFEFSVRMFTPPSCGLDARRWVPRGDRIRRRRRAPDPGARGPTDDGRWPEVSVTVSALSRHPRVTIPSLRSLWGGGRVYRSQGGVQRLELGVDELDRTLDALLVIGVVHPPAHARGVRQGNSNRLAVGEGLPDAGVGLRRPSSCRIASPPTGTISRAAAAGAPIRAERASSCSRAAESGRRRPPAHDPIAPVTDAQ